jgi:hypothetical protein
MSWHRDFETAAAAMIRGGDFKATTLFFLKAMQGSPFAGPAKRVANTFVGVGGWEAAAADIAKLAAKGTTVTAIGLDLTGHNEGPDPVLEFALYDDHAFRFSGSLQEARDKAATYGAPWLGRFSATGDYFKVRNIGELYRAVAEYEARHWNLDSWSPTLSEIDQASYEELGPPSKIAALKKAQPGWLAATWYLYFRIHHAIRRDIANGALPVAIKVVVGQHDFGPWFADVYEAKASAKAARAGERVAADRRKERERAFDRATAELIDDLKRHRRDVAGWKDGHNEDKRATYAEYLKARHADIFASLNLPEPRPLWQMDDTEFRTLIANVRAAREQKKKRAA